MGSINSVPTKPNKDIKSNNKPFPQLIEPRVFIFFLLYILIEFVGNKSDLITIGTAPVAGITLPMSM